MHNSIPFPVVVILTPKTGGPSPYPFVVTKASAPYYNQVVTKETGQKVIFKEAGS